MKQILTFCIVALVAFSLTSCNNVEKILPKQDGKWAVSAEQHVEYDLNGDLDTMYTDYNTGFYIFEDDGTGMYQDENGNDDGEFEWATTEDKIILSEGLFALTFDITESSKKSQRWAFILTEDQSFGGRQELYIDLEKVD